jgi:hypothetical protein
MEITTAKQVAQSFYLDEIVTHELILEAYHSLEKELKAHDIRWDKSDIIYKLVKMVLSHEFAEIFNIQKHNVMKFIYDEYNSEVEYLYAINQKK